GQPDLAHDLRPHVERVAGRRPVVDAKGRPVGAHAAIMPGSGHRLVRASRPGRAVAPGRPGRERSDRPQAATAMRPVIGVALSTLSYIGDVRSVISWISASTSGEASVSTETV